MGHYRKTSTCSYCWTTGHTKRNCPKMKTEASRGEVWAQDQIKAYQRSVTSRKCSYCKEGGHNKTGCSIRKQHGIIYQKTLDIFVKDINYRCEAVGIKVGTLIAVRRRESQEETKVFAIIEKIHIADRNPDYKWITHRYKLNDSQQTDREALDYEAYHGYSTTLNKHLKEPMMFLRSLSGAGLGYWGDCEVAQYEICSSLRNIETKGFNFEIISAV